MADYLPLISRAIANLPHDDADARRMIYERARAALEQQLRSLDPPLGETEIARERLSLDAAIARIENERANTERTLAFADAPMDDERFEPREAAALPEERPSEPSPPAREAVAVAAPERMASERPRRGRAQSTERPRLDHVQARPDRSRSVRMLVLAVVLAIVVAGIAALAIYLPKTRTDVAAGGQGARPAEQSGGERKFSDRVGAAPGTSAAAPAAPASPPAASTPPSASVPAATPPAAPDIAVAQRAILYEENPQTPQTPAATPGRVLWRLESVPAGQGQPADTAIRADIDLPEARLQLALTLRRNTDATLPASHLVQLTFTSTGSGEPRIVKDVGLPQMKTEENARGAPLAGLPVPVTQNVFLIGLSSIRADADRNVDLLKTRPWFDLPIRLADGHRAILAIEKGTAGDKVFRDAFASWQ